MIHILSALIPIFSLIIIGYFLKKIKFPSDEFWPQADKLTYYILMPSLLIYKLSTANLDSTNSVSFILTALITITIIWILLIILNKFLCFNSAAFTSVVQGSIRFNTYVFLALVDSIFEDVGIVYAALLLTFVIPYINILCISNFALYINENRLNFLYLLKSILTNPLIIACFIGGSINFIGITLPIVLERILFIISSAALPLGLLSVGFALVIKEIKYSKSEIFYSNFFKLILTPLIMFFIAKIFNLDNQILAILIIFSVLPTAPSAFVLARQLKGDIRLMSSIISVQTILSALFILLALNYFI